MERYSWLKHYMEPKEEEILRTFLQLQNTGEQDLAPESDKNQKDIQSYFCSDTLSSNEKTWNQETKEPKCHNYWLNFGL